MIPVSQRTGSGAQQTRTARIAVLVAAATVAAIDLTAKAASEARLAESPVDLGLIQLQLAYNPGVAFSMGDRLPASVIVAVTATICGVIALYAWFRAPRAGWIERIAHGAVIGGAVANVIDRGGDGLVTDYLHTGWWPTFNLADTFLVIGCVVMALMGALPDRVADTGTGEAEDKGDAGDTISDSSRS